MLKVRKCEVCVLAENKKILISIPENLLRELDNAVKEEETNRSDFIRKSIRFYLIEKRKLEIRNKMKAGYLEMSKINKIPKAVKRSRKSSCRMAIRKPRQKNTSTRAKKRTMPIKPVSSPKTAKIKSVWASGR